MVEGWWCRDMGYEKWWFLTISGVAVCKIASDRDGVMLFAHDKNEPKFNKVTTFPTLEAAMLAAEVLYG